jgi:hypothetical protein
MRQPGQAVAHLVSVPRNKALPGIALIVVHGNGLFPEQQRRRMGQSSFASRAMGLARIDFTPTHRQPPTARVAAATVLSIGGSLLADALLVAIGTAIFPATKGYVRYEFSDYAKLTVIGVIIACAAWPIVTRITSSPRWLFFRLAILVTLTLHLPDLWLLVCGPRWRPESGVTRRSWPRVMVESGLAALRMGDGPRR